MASKQTAPRPATNPPGEEWTRFENTIAAILTLAVLGTAQEHPPEQVIRSYADMVQRLRAGNVVNP